MVFFNQDLNINFRTIILPEALKAIQAQEASVCNALEDLEKLFVDASHPLDQIVSQLEVLHRNAIMGVEVCAWFYFFNLFFLWKYQT